MTQTPDAAGKPAPAPTPQPGPARKDRKAKIIFLLLVLGVATVAWLYQVRGKQLGWPTDLPAQLEAARKSQRPLLALFRDKRGGDATRRLIDGSLRHTITANAIRNHNYLTVDVVLPEGTASEPARKYGIGELPAVVIFEPQGQVLHWKAGFTGPAEMEGILAQYAPKQP